MLWKKIINEGKILKTARKIEFSGGSCELNISEKLGGKKVRLPIETNNNQKQFPKLQDLINLNYGLKNSQPQKKIHDYMERKTEKGLVCTCAHWAVSMDFKRGMEKGKSYGVLRERKSPTFLEKSHKSKRGKLWELGYSGGGSMCWPTSYNIDHRG